MEPTPWPSMQSMAHQPSGVPFWRHHGHAQAQLTPLYGIHRFLSSILLYRHYKPQMQQHGTIRRTYMGFARPPSGSYISPLRTTSARIFRYFHYNGFSRPETHGDPTDDRADACHVPRHASTPKYTQPDPSNFYFTAQTVSISFISVRLFYPPASVLNGHPSSSPEEMSTGDLFRFSLLSAATAGFVVDDILFPLDTLNTLLQLAS